MNTLKDKQYVIFLLRIKYVDGSYITLGNLTKFNKTMFKDILDYYYFILKFKFNQYFIDNIIQVVFSYKIIPDDKLKLKNNNIDINKNSNNIKFKAFKGNYKLPSTADYTKWGTIIHQTKTLIIVNNLKFNYFFKIKINKNKLIRTVELINKNNTLEFIDEINDTNNLNTFNRIINNHKYYYKNNEIFLKTLIRNNKFLSSISKDKKLINNIITLDIETKKINIIITPYCICYFDGKKSYSFYLSDYKDHFELLNKVIKSLND